MYISPNFCIEDKILLFPFQKKQKRTSFSGICKMQYQLPQPKDHFSKSKKLPNIQHHSYLIVQHSKLPFIAVIVLWSLGHNVLKFYTHPFLFVWPLKGIISSSVIVQDLISLPSVVFKSFRSAIVTSFSSDSSFTKQLQA